MIESVEGLERVPERQRAALSAALCGQQTLEDVLRWSFSSVLPVELVEVVVQDEFTHDVVFAWGGGLYLVFDTT